MTSTDKSIRIEVEDNGPGVADSVAKHLFEPFITTKQRGMGLGLALSRELIGAHGGTIAWESRQPAAGTRFIIEIAAAPERPHGT